MRLPRRKQQKGHQVKDVFTLFTDGSTRNNGHKDPSQPAYGAYAGLMTIDGQEFGEVVYGGGPNRTINWCELAAVVHVIRALTEGYDLDGYGVPVKIDVVSDSAYVVNGASQNLRHWVQNDWVGKMGGPIQNRELWEELWILLQDEAYEITFYHIKAHTNCQKRDYIFNDKCDALAKDHLVSLLVEGKVITEETYNPTKHLDFHVHKLMKHERGDDYVNQPRQNCSRRQKRGGGTGRFNLGR
jgi:ribonuclease HI